MTTPHVHKDLIIAWANGAQIQFWNEDMLEWCDIESPTWVQYTEYRVKTEQKLDVIEYRASMIGGASIQMQGANLKLTFDGSTGKLKSAEVL